MLTYDNLSTGHDWAVLHGRLVAGDFADTVSVGCLRDFRPDAVMHFAAHIQVEESVREPLKYYINNTCNALTLLKTVPGTESGILFSRQLPPYTVHHKGSPSPRTRR
ncbi:MAG TPA: GDP-mannose 4,6-dehydratase [Dissulfurispiraceae bacterium]|nr:GDP-mannose 4,6-dehydratase [Dissulfurispiraceae bacterium]